jgi:hypothetical protein
MIIAFLLLLLLLLLFLVHVEINTTRLYQKKQLTIRKLIKRDEFTFTEFYCLYPLVHRKLHDELTIPRLIKP